MPYFYFHLATALDRNPDEIQLKLPDVETAYLEACRTVQDM